MNKFKIEITSVPDRQKLVAEIWYSRLLIAEINQEKENLELELYQLEKVSVDLEDFIEILKKAKTELNS